MLHETPHSTFSQHSCFHSNFIQSCMVAWLHLGRADFENRQLNSEEQGGKIAETPLLIQELDIPQHFEDLLLT